MKCTRFTQSRKDPQRSQSLEILPLNPESRPLYPVPCILYPFPISATLKKYCYKYPRPAVTVDIALFSESSRLEILLIRRARDPFKGGWALPGGFVDENESLEAAAARELEEETGITGVSLEQVAAFGDPGRDPRGHTVSILFLALLPRKREAVAADDASELAWHSARKPPRLAFDHAKLIKAAVRQLESRSTK